MAAPRADTRAASLRAASRFVGNAVNRIDQKGRVSVPADLRRYIDPGSEAPSPVMYCFPSFLGGELQCGGEDLVNILLDVVATQDVFDRRRAALEKAVTTFTERLYFDDNGRVVVPKRLREHAGLEGSVAFAGHGALFTMSPPEPVEDVWAIAQSLSDEEREILRGRAMPSTIAKGEAE